MIQDKPSFKQAFEMFHETFFGLVVHFLFDILFKLQSFLTQVVRYKLKKTSVFLSVKQR